MTMSFPVRCEVCGQVTRIPRRRIEPTPLQHKPDCPLGLALDTRRAEAARELATGSSSFPFAATSAGLGRNPESEPPDDE